MRFEIETNFLEILITYIVHGKVNTRITRVTLKFFESFL